MEAYRIKMPGKYDVIVISPKMVDALLDKIRHSTIKELVIPAEEILPQGYHEYLSCVLNANVDIAGTLPDRNVYALIAGQIKKLQCNEQDCFDRVDVAEPENNPQFDLDTSEEFYIVTKQEKNQFHYVFKGENDEEISIVLEYL